MRVTDVRTILLSGPRAHMPGGGQGQISKIVVRVDAENGLYGLGEIENFMGAREAAEHIGACLIGRNVFDVRPFVSEMMYGTLPPHAPDQLRAEPSRFTNTWAPPLVCSPTAVPTGPVVWAMSGVEMAMCDLAGKALETPVYNLLGGKYRDRIRVYVDRSSPDENANDLDAWRRMGVQAVEDGFTQIKIDAAYAAPDCTDDVWNRSFGSKQANRIYERIAAVRETVGSDVDICVDCHRLYTVTASIRLADRLAPLQLKWLEDPTPAHSPDACAQVRERSAIPICAGEMLTAEESRLWIESGACDIIHPDVLFCGGLSEMRKIADYAELNCIPMAMHANGGGLATIAAAHVAAATRNFLGLEYHHIETDWIGNYTRRDGTPLFTDGHVAITDAPGLGVELDEDICGRYLGRGERLF